MRPPSQGFGLEDVPLHVPTKPSFLMRGHLLVCLAIKAGVKIDPTPNPYPEIGEGNKKIGGLGVDG